MVAAITTREQALDVLAQFIRANTPVPPPTPNFQEWAEANYWIQPDSTGSTAHLIKLIPHQPVIINYALDQKNEITTFIYSSIKKSGKTAIAGALARYIAETFGPYSEVFCLANDLEQARGRVYQAAIRSLELDPRYNAKSREIPDYWRVIQREATHIPSNSIIRAVSSDYKGEAGSNPTATLWSELWGYSLDKDLRLWEELTPVPTRRSVRIVETYAGYEDEPGPLWDLWQVAKDGRQLTHNDIDWPFDGPIPLWHNERAHLFAYIDQGPLARRMPWQQGKAGEAYYIEQAASLPPQAFQRLHLNYWTTSVTQFIPIQWWYACYDPTLQPLLPGSKKPVVLGADASVSGDCTALTMVSRNDRNDREVDHHMSWVWTPPKGGTISYSDTLEPMLRQLCKDYNVVQVAYDAYQLHHLMSNLTNENVAWCRPFNQAGDRLKADKQLYDVIRERRIHHRNDDPNMEEHLKHAASKQMKDEDTRLRLVKKSTESKIDDVVAESMAVSECLRLVI